MDNFGYIDWLTYPAEQHESEPLKINRDEVEALHALFEAAGHRSLNAMLIVVGQTLGKSVSRLEDLTVGEYGRIRYGRAGIASGPAA